jgi:hypothetical protein
MRHNEVAKIKAFSFLKQNLGTQKQRHGVFLGYEGKKPTCKCKALDGFTIIHDKDCRIAEVFEGYNLYIEMAKRFTR